MSYRFIVYFTILPVAQKMRCQMAGLMSSYFERMWAEVAMVSSRY